MPALVIALVFALVAAFAALSNNAFENAKVNRLEWQKAAQAVVSSSVEQYYRETGSLPASLTALANTSGYEHLRGFLSESQTNGVFRSANRNLVDISTASLTDAFWQYSRTAVTFQEDRNVPLSTYLAINSCGTGAFGTATSWCGQRGTGWNKVESRVVFADQLFEARKSLNLTLSKIAEYYNSAGAFPDVATATALATLVTPQSGSAVGTDPATCSGLFVWQGIPFECSDLYNRFGNRVAYQRTSTKRIVLSSLSTIRNASAAQVVVATELNIP